MTSPPRKFNFDWSAGNVLGALLAIATLLIALWAIARALLDQEVMELLLRTCKAAIDFIFVAGVGFMLGYLGGSHNGYRKGFADGEKHAPYGP